MQIKIISIGKIKENFLKDAIAEYSKRLSKYTKLDIVELPDIEIPEKENDKIFTQIKLQEGVNILKKIKDNDFVITLEIEGKNLSSTELAEFFSKQMIDGKSNFVFVIGGSLGISDDVKNRSNFKLSFSKMTFPHQLFRVMLLEQIYRAFKINNNEVYHK
ncbi:23S rRNA (pseudouridine(1915)-N(3))-methyltransferase RlmH [Bacteroidia bacterium]|nr:23S rRNA (pseudouridine(1915)-N(3))-methyltransferase RlmH [Bacteroidia bacterium]